MLRNREERAQYTIQFQDILKLHPEFWDTFNIDTTMFPSDFEFKTLFSDHYKFREIGFDTIARFAHVLNDDIRRLSPEFLFRRNRQQALLLENDPNIDFSTTSTTQLGSINDNMSNSRPLTQKTISEDMIIDGLNRSVSSGGDSSTYEGHLRSKAAILDELIRTYRNHENDFIDSFDSLFMGVF